MKKKEALSAVIDAAGAEVERLLELAGKWEAAGCVNAAAKTRREADYLDGAIDKLVES